MAHTRDEAIAERETDLNYERMAFDPLTAAEQAEYDEGYEAGADSVEGDQPPAPADDPYGAGWREGNAARRKLASERADQAEAELAEALAPRQPDYIAQAAAKRAGFDARYNKARADREARQEASGLEISVTVFASDTHPRWALDRVERGLGI